MTSNLSTSLEKLRLGEDSVAGDRKLIEELLEGESLLHQAPKSREQALKELEESFLTPSIFFSRSWLNKLQQRWDILPDSDGLLNLAGTQTRTVTRFVREGLEGRVTGYREVTVPASSATAKNSTSLLRKPAKRSQFVRGGAGFYPFAPGGLDSVEAAAAFEDASVQKAQGDSTSESRNALDRVISLGPEGSLLDCAPGLQRGIDFSKGAPSGSQKKDDKKEEDEVVQTLNAPRLTHDENATAGQEQLSTEVEENGQDQRVERTPGEEEEDDMDSLLPVEFPALKPHGQLAMASSRRGGREWAHMVDVKREIPNFRELVPKMAREWPFELDTFQKEAVYHLENSDSVFVAAHTSAGKTVVAEYAIALAAQHMTKAIYTSPIKALSNQKFRDFRHTFEDVGILTGDVQIRPEASCLIMTTEILRSMLYRGADLIRDVEYVIFDEVHYVNDLERGVVWEEVIIMLPEHVTLILLSATVPNTYEFASWVGRTKKKDIYVISTPKRPVPLEHYLWANKRVCKIVDANKHFLEKGWKEANDIISGKDKIKAAPASDVSAPAQRGSGRGQPQRGAPRGGQQGRGRGQAQRGGTSSGSTVRGGKQGGRTTMAQDRTLWVHLVQYLKKEDLLPACIFVFSKRRCEENADALSNLDYCTASEKSAIHMIIEKSLARLKPEDRGLPQIRRLRELLNRGIAVHHGGLLPIVKEMVELLFARTLVKVLFATETFAMGLNLPTRTVVFSGFRKHDGRSFRDLLPGEYTQMAGRAGRRGLDSVGSVIIVAPGSDEAPPVAALRNMILGDPSKLRSQFRLTYNMILNLLRVEALKIEEMIKRSFSENATQALLPDQEKQVRLSETDLANIRREKCDVCDADIETCHDSSMLYKKLTSDLHLGALATPIGRKLFSPRRVVIFQKDGVRCIGILAREGLLKGATSSVELFEVVPSREIRTPSDLLPYLPSLARFVESFEVRWKSLRLSNVPLSDIECITKAVLKIDLQAISKREQISIEKALEQLRKFCLSWDDESLQEVDWSKLRELTLRNLLDDRRQVSVKIQNCACISCLNFLKHFSMRHDEWLVQENISQLRQLMSDQNLQLLPDYEQRISVLRDLGFIDESTRVQLKGKVACEIHSVDELVLTELILENVLADYQPEEIVALLSAFVFQEKTDTAPTLTPSLEKGQKKIIEISERVNSFQTLHQVILSGDDSNDFVTRPRFGLVEVVYEWARGMSFNRITDLTDVLEGTIVRIITRLDETCREVKNAARIIGDPTLFTKMQDCQEMIKRDITAVASLYM